jgi:MscS family membrane protein
MEINDVTVYFEKNANWIVLCFIVVFMTLLFDFIQRRVLNRVAKRFERTPNLWDDAVLESLRRPFSWLIWVVGITSAVKIIEHQTQSTVFWFIDPLRNLCVIGLLTWFVVRFITHAEKNIIIGRQAK